MTIKFYFRNMLTVGECEISNDPEEFVKQGQDAIENVASNSELFSVCNIFMFRFINLHQMVRI